jgi:hypothetical protein
MTHAAGPAGGNRCPACPGGRANRVILRGASKFLPAVFLLLSRGLAAVLGLIWPC